MPMSALHHCPVRIFHLVFSLLLVAAAVNAYAQDPPATPPRLIPADWQISWHDEPILGARMRVVSAGARDKPALILVHGLGQNGLMDWNELIEILKADYRIYAMDLPGFGKSSYVGDRLSPENFAAVIHWFVMKEELKQFHLAGHSMGGAVAVYYAAHYPERISQLTLIDVAGILHRATFVKSIAYIDPSRYDFLPDFLQRSAARLRDFSDSWVEKLNLLPDLTQPLLKSDLAWGALLGDEPNTNAALSLINTDYSYLIDQLPAIPTTIIWGEDDAIAPPRTGQLLQGRFADSRLHIIKDAGHVPLTSHANQVAALIRSDNEPREELPSLAETTELPDLNCYGKTGGEYSGRYQRVILQSCMDIRLVDVQAQSMTLVDSSVEFLRVKLDYAPHDGAASGVGIRADRSAMVMTDVELRAPTTIQMNSSRLDMAGAHLIASEKAIEVETLSVVIASVSDVKSPGYTGKLHGALRLYDAVAETFPQLQSAAQPIVKN